MVDSTRLAFIDDKILLSERAAVRAALQHEPARRPELARVYDALTAEVDQRAEHVWSMNYEPRQESDMASRAPADISTWELIAAYRHAWALSYYGPRGYLAKALANWLLTSQRELESRGATAPSTWLTSAHCG
jgi:hypothetical protein